MDIKILGIVVPALVIAIIIVLALLQPGISRNFVPVESISYSALFPSVAPQEYCMQQKIPLFTLSLKNDFVIGHVEELYQYTVCPYPADVAPFVYLNGFYEVATQPSLFGSVDSVEVPAHSEQKIGYFLRSQCQPQKGSAKPATNNELPKYNITAVVLFEQQQGQEYAYRECAQYTTEEYAKALKIPVTLP